MDRQTKAQEGDMTDGLSFFHLLSQCAQPEPEEKASVQFKITPFKSGPRQLQVDFTVPLLDIVGLWLSTGHSAEWQCQDEKWWARSILSSSLPAFLYGVRYDSVTDLAHFNLAVPSSSLSTLSFICKMSVGLRTLNFGSPTSISSPSLLGDWWIECHSNLGPPSCANSCQFTITLVDPCALTLLVCNFFNALTTARSRNSPPSSGQRTQKVLAPTPKHSSTLPSYTEEKTLLMTMGWARGRSGAHVHAIYTKIIPQSHVPEKHWA